MAKFIINASTHAFFTIGEIEAPNKEKAEELAYKMMEDGKVDTPCLCHYCAGNIELNDFEINEGDVYEVGT